MSVERREGGLQLTVRERILIHLADRAPRVETYPVPAALTQPGVAAAVGIQRRHVPQYMRPLIHEGLVTEQSAPAAGAHQRRKVYFLTHAGRQEAIRLREWAHSQTVSVRDGESVREVPVGRLLSGSAKGIGLLDIARQMARTGVLEAPSAGPSASSLVVEQLSDAPRVGTFMGRRRELAEVMQESEGPRVFVVRGVAGIGKSSFAAKACEMMRGRRNLFWHRIRPWDSPSTVLSSLGRFVSALDRPGLLAVVSRGDVASAAAVLRQDLPGTRAFLVFDDAQVGSADVMAVFRMLAEDLADAPDVRMLLLSRRALPFYHRGDVILGGLLKEVELRGLDAADAAALLAIGGDSAALVGLGRRLAGHPLFLELVRARRPETSGALRDVRRFIEEEIYGKLAADQRGVMKLGSLYRVPVPAAALLGARNGSYEALVALEDQLLLRPVGEDRYEIHDTIRDFFAGVLTPTEREAFGAFAVAQLRELASASAASGDAVGCVACLSNALLIGGPRRDRAGLCESLGDANERIGDLLGVSTMYRAAMALAPDAETVARLHRKLATALEDRGRLADASAEVDAGVAALGRSTSLERGWLQLLRARIANASYDRFSAERHAEAALQVFRAAGERDGSARALLEAGKAAMWTGSASAEGTSRADLHFQEALELANSPEDPALEARIHIAMAVAIGYGSGDYEKGMAHWHAIESSPAVGDPHVRAEMRLERAWFVLRVRRDYDAAESDLSEARRVATRIHDDLTLADVDYQSAVILRERGRYDEAGRLNESAGSRMAQAGIAGFAANAYFVAVQCYLAAGDWDGYRRVASALRTPQLRRGLRQDAVFFLSHRGMETLMRGDLRGFERAFAQLFRYVDTLPPPSLWRAVRAWWGHFYYGIGLQALGREREAAEHRRRALQMVRSTNNRQAMWTVESDFGAKIAATIREKRMAH